MPSFCTYCGKCFTRKEHLERHLPSHTNIKPYRCLCCHLSFARKDLLQRHTMTYHEFRDYIEPSTTAMPNISGRTPIACQNCANAKTGCDKRVPCSRCAEKDLPCAARYARRSSKAAVRAAQAMANLSRQLEEHRSQPQYLLPTQEFPDCYAPTVTASSDYLTVQSESILASSPLTVDTGVFSDGLEAPSPQEFASHTFDSPTKQLQYQDGFYSQDNTFDRGNFGYQDYWPAYSPCLSALGVNTPLHHPDMKVGSFIPQSDGSSTSSVLYSSSGGSACTSDKSFVNFDSNVLSSNCPRPHTGQTDTPEFGTVLAAESAWPIARCSRLNHPGGCPRTAIIHLEYLEQYSRGETSWAQLENHIKQQKSGLLEPSLITPMSQLVRDQIIATVQTSLQKARQGLDTANNGSSNIAADANFLLLPSASALDHFIRLSLRGLSCHFGIPLCGNSDASKMAPDGQNSTLLTLLMIAHGASMVSIKEARHLSTGLIETCRISLANMLENRVEIYADIATLRCALLFTMAGAWSGDKWLMDIAIRQRGTYLATLRQTGMLESLASRFSEHTGHGDIQSRWSTWAQRESEHRLVYDWVMVDQEISLFEDVSPSLLITNLRCPLPGLDSLWMANDAMNWYSSIQSTCGERSNNHSPHLRDPPTTQSLHDLFNDFTHDTLPLNENLISSQQLRLLLHPLQSLVFHYRQVQSYLSYTNLPCNPAVFEAGSNKPHIVEVDALLKRWYGISQSLRKLNPDCLVIRESMISYHLIYLNLVTDFMELERLARSDCPDAFTWNTPSCWSKCILDRDEAASHCGEVFRNLKLIPLDRRPLWWPAAVYRTTLILWADAFGRSDQLHSRHSRSPTWSVSSGQSQSLPLMTTLQEHLGDATIDTDEPSPVEPVSVPSVRNGSGYTGLQSPADILCYGVQIIDEGLSTSMGDGIRRKLINLGQRWTGDGLSLSS